MTCEGFEDLASKVNNALQTISLRLELIPHHLRARRETEVERCLVEIRAAVDQIKFALLQHRTVNESPARPRPPQ